MEAKPYTLEEQRVCDYLKRIMPDIGCGDDPVGFLIASHGELVRRAKQARNALDGFVPP